MILITHILIALTSLIATTWLAFSPSKLKLRISYGLIAATLVSGTYLVVSLHTPMLRACSTGLVYLAVALSGVAVAHYRLAHANIES